MEEYIKKTIEVYNTLGTNYLASIENAAPDEIHMFLNALPTTGRVLDVGCAGGRDSRIFADHGLQVVGIDLCKPFLKEAKKRVPTGVFLKKDLLQLDVEEASLDGVWACAVLLHLKKEDLPRALGNIHRVLKPGGLLFVGLKQGEGERSIVDRLSDSHERFFSFYQLPEIETFVTAAGFDVTYSKVCHDDTGRSDVTWIRMIAKKI